MYDILLIVVHASKPQIVCRLACVAKIHKIHDTSIKIPLIFCQQNYQQG